LQPGQPGQPAGSVGSHRVFSFSIFFQSGLVPASGRPGFKSIGSSKGLKRLVQNNPDKKIANRNHSQLSNKTSNKTKQEAGRKMLITLARNALK